MYCVEAFPSNFPCSREVRGHRRPLKQLQQETQVISGNFRRKVITAENGSRLRQSGYISAPDLSPPKSHRKTTEKDEKEGEKRRERERGWKYGDEGGEITPETERRKAFKQEFELRC